MRRISVELMGADIYASIRNISNSGIVLHKIRVIDSVTVRFLVFYPDLPSLRHVTDHHGDTLRIYAIPNLLWTGSTFYHRPIFIFGVLLALLLSLWIPTVVLFVEVQGNERIPSSTILEYAAQCGIRLGSQCRQVRSEWVKNALLEAMPELQWVGVNIRGCVATISVSEREKAVKREEYDEICSIISCRDAIIQTVTVRQGNPICKVGQAVKEGQVLVSAYQDRGICLWVTAADAEVFGLTEHDLTVISPTAYSCKISVRCVKRNFSLIIGKNRINFANNSGILGGGCVRIYEQKYMTLPGGFTLPISLCIETWLEYETQETTMRLQEEKILAELDRYLLRQTISGTILSRMYVASDQHGDICLQVRYFCSEMIGRIRPEGILKDYESDRENR